MAVAALLLAGAVTACHPAQPSVLHVDGALVFSKLTVGRVAAECIPAANQGGYFRTRGIVDLAATHEYVVGLQTRNLLTKTTTGTPFVQGAKDLRTDVSTIQLLGIDYYLEFDNKSEGPLKGLKIGGQSGDGHWYVPISGSIDALATMIVRTTSLTPDIGIQLMSRWAQYKFNNSDAAKYTTKQTVLMHMSVEGVMQDGEYVKSNDFVFPIDLCWGCLLTVPEVPPQTADSQAKDLFQICATKQPADGYVLPCFLGQDEAYDCRVYCFACTFNEAIVSSDEKAKAVYGCDSLFCPPRD